MTDKKYISLKKVKLCPPSKIVGLIELAEVKAVGFDLVDSIAAEYSVEHAAKLPIDRIIAKNEKSDPKFHQNEVAS